MQIKIIIFILFLNSNVFSQHLFTSSELEKYIIVSKLELKRRYSIDDFFNNDKLLKNYFKVDSLNIISIPLFNREETLNLLKNNKALSNPNYQKVLIYYKDNLVSEFIIENFLTNYYNDINDEPLLYYTFDEYDFPIIIGSKFPIYFKKNIYDTNKDIFMYENFEGLFMFQNNKWYYLTKKYPEFIENNINIIENIKSEIQIIDKKFIRKLMKREI